MKAKEYLEDLVSEDVMGFDITDPKVSTALCLYAERINKNNGYSLIDLETMLSKYICTDEVKYCIDFVEKIYFYRNNLVSNPVDD